MVDAGTAFLVLGVASFTPPLLFLWLVRSTERYGQEPWDRLIRTFFWGALAAVIISVILEVLLFAFFKEVDRVYVFSGRFPNLGTIVLALVIAPLVEEFGKGVGVYIRERDLQEPEDGLVYGAASGFGFGASENLLYGVSAFALTGSIGVSLLVVFIRSISSALLHASASATFGAGIARARLWPHLHNAFPYYLLAVAMHSTFNFLASLGELEPGLLGGAGDVIGLIAAGLMAVFAFVIIHSIIRREDQQRVAY